MQEFNHESLFGTMQDKERSTIIEARRITQEYIMQKPSIDKLLKDKVDDYVLIREIPLPVVVGSKKIYIGTFTMETCDIFFREYARIMGLLSARYAGMEMSIKLLGDGKSLYPLLLKDMLLRENIYRLINRTILKKQNYIDPVTNRVYKLPKVSLGYFRKNVTIEGVMQILMMTYIFNFDATKRSLNLLVGEMRASQVSEICVSTWLANLTGISGKFLKGQSEQFEPYIIALQNAERLRQSEAKEPG